MREGCTVLAALMNCVRFSGREQVHSGRLYVTAARSDLAQCRHLIEHPEAAAERGTVEVVAVNDDVANRGDGHVELKRLPMIAVIERDVDAQLGRSIEQAFLLGVFLDGVYKCAFGNSIDRVLPRFAAVVCAVDVRAIVGEAMTIDGSIGRLDVEVS